ncbi:MAG: hypothetical protein GX335_00835 [Firmicutes bacterium]|nr:hypothetical protein [Bacillota bacterium]
MRLVNLSRHRDKLTLIGGSLFALDPQAFLDGVLSGADGSVQAAGRVFPRGFWAARRGLG